MFLANIAEEITPFVDLNEVHLLTKFHADQRSLRGLKLKKNDIFRHFKFVLLKNQQTTPLMGLLA